MPGKIFELFLDPECPRTCLSPAQFSGLLHPFEKEEKTICLIGFSWGGFHALQLALRFPQYISQLVLIGICDQYESTLISELKTRLKNNKNETLMAFYRACFSQTSSFKTFWREMGKAYCEQASTQALCQDLDDLGSLCIRSEDLIKAKALFGDKLSLYHGREDQIASLTQAKRLSEESGVTLTLIEGGHVPERVLNIR